mmetsp:Transcript_24003/g.39165  ORF Transcript_24003/g.39165 Transcript_24003/m.39165 type:complete len:202 (-) Transcript_24003:28-633(-)
MKFHLRRQGLLFIILRFLVWITHALFQVLKDADRVLMPFGGRRCDISECLTIFVVFVIDCHVVDKAQIQFIVIPCGCPCNVFLFVVKVQSRRVGRFFLVFFIHEGHVEVLIFVFVPLGNVVVIRAWHRYFNIRLLFRFLVSPTIATDLFHRVTIFVLLRCPFLERTRLSESLPVVVLPQFSNTRMKVGAPLIGFICQKWLS